MTNTYLFESNNKNTPPRSRSVVSRSLRGLFVLALLLAAPAVSAAEDIAKPLHDKRAYQLLTLPNQLRILLISDPETDKAAASLDVGVGYFDDPAERPGLAHFLEHMLFLGTVKYPQADEYREFISTHGGRDNAFTTDQDTTFFFDIDKDYLAQALDRFSQFFIAPLFNEDYVAREVQAVDSEYRLKIQDDARRLWQVQKATANPTHPFAKFSVGNRETLGAGNLKELRQTLIDFYHRHYSANRMTLVVLGKEALPELRSMVETYFSAIPNQQLPSRTVQAPLFLARQKQVWINVQPVKEQRLLRLSFSIPWHREDYLSKPAMLIAHLLGHEGEGSLYQLLHRKGWVNSLNISNGIVGHNEATLDIDLNLTEEGLRFISTITDRVFQYIELIRRHGIQPWIYEELRQINDLAFQYREAPQPLNEVRQLSGNLQRFPPSLVLRGPYEFKAYPAESLQGLLARLVPENLRLTLMAGDLPTSELEPYYRTPYRITQLAPELRRRWKQTSPDLNLAIPEKNPFLPEQAQLKPLKERAAVPMLVHEQKGLRVWHKQDGQFRLPKADVFISLATPRAKDTVQHSILTRIYLMLVNDRLDVLAYPAALAGLHYTTAPSKEGIILVLGGYDEKQAQLLNLLLDELLDPQINPRRFAIVKEQLRRSWKNSRHDRPYLQLDRELRTILHHQRWAPETYLEALEPISPRQLAEFIPRLLAELDIEMLSHGNLTAAESRALGQHVAARFYARGRPVPPQPLRFTLLRRNQDYLRRFHLDHEDAGILVYYQGMAEDPAADARIQLLQQLIKGPFFHLLRTRDQLGYVVFTTPQTILRRPGLEFVVQSPTRNMEQLHQRIETFLKEEFPPFLEAMSEDEFNQYRQGLITEILEKDNSMSARSHRYFKMLLLGHTDFDYQQRLAEAVSRIDKKTMQDFYRRWIAETDGGRLFIEAYGIAHPEQESTLPAAGKIQVIEDIERFRQHMPAGEVPKM